MKCVTKLVTVIEAAPNTMSTAGFGRILRSRILRNGIVCHDVDLRDRTFVFVNDDAQEDEYEA